MLRRGKRQGQRGGRAGGGSGSSPVGSSGSSAYVYGEADWSGSDDTGTGRGCPPSDSVYGSAGSCGGDSSGGYSGGSDSGSCGGGE